MHTMRTRKGRLLELARQIAEGEKHWISPFYGVGRDAITPADYAALVEFSGEQELYFDDDDFFAPTEADRHPRVMFLCMAINEP